MGYTTTIGTLEEMCDLMCDNILPEEASWWVFTFGSGHKFAGKYVRIWGTYDKARQKMINKYGLEWGFQYSLKEWTEIENDPKRWWPIETQMEVIQ